MAPAAHPRKPRAPPPGTGGHTPPSAPPPPPHSAHQPLIATVVESALRSLPPVASYDPAVVPALVDALLADAAALLTDARAYASHAGRADLAAEDVRLAVDGCARGGAGGVGATPGGTTPDGAPLPGAGGGVHPLDLAALARVVNATPLPLCRAAGGGVVLGGGGVLLPCGAGMELNRPSRVAVAAAAARAASMGEGRAVAGDSVAAAVSTNWAVAGSRPCLAAVELVSSVVAVVASMQRCVDVTVVALATGATARPVATNFDLAGPPRCQWAL